MALQEIVGAIIDSDEVTNDIAMIGRSVAAGRHVEYITRKRAQTVASFRSELSVGKLAQCPTLFLMDDGICFFMPPQSAGHTGL